MSERDLRDLIARALSAADSGMPARAIEILRLGAFERAAPAVAQDWTIMDDGLPSGRFRQIVDFMATRLERESGEILSRTWIRLRCWDLLAELATVENLGPLDERPFTDHDIDAAKTRFRQIITARLAGDLELARQLCSVHPGRGFDLAWVASALVTEVVRMWAETNGETPDGLWAQFSTFVEAHLDMLTD